MGKVRPAYIKRTAKKLILQYGDRFTDEFEYNKQVVQELAIVPSKRVRNRIAGYITRLKKIEKMRLEREKKIMEES